MHNVLKADVAKLRAAMPDHAQRGKMASQWDAYFGACDPARIKRVLDALEAAERDADLAHAALRYMVDNIGQPRSLETAAGFADAERVASLRAGK